MPCNSVLYIILHLKEGLLETLTSVVVPISADGLHVLVSGGTVPTLLRTGELGTGPATVSEYAEDVLRLPFFLILFQTLFIVSASS